MTTPITVAANKIQTPTNLDTLEYTKINTRWGLMYHLKEDKDSLISILTQKGVYQNYVIELAKTLTRPGGWVLDIGANIGAHSIPIAKTPHVSGVWAFEACPDNVCCLTKNMTKHHLEKKLKIVNVGLSDNRQTLVFNQIKNKRGASSFDATGLDPKTIHQVNIQCQPLDDWLESWKNQDQLRIDFIKIDVQNYEYPVLTGAKRVLSHYQPAVLVECPARDQYEIVEYKKITTFFRSIGYREKQRYNKDCLFVPNLVIRTNKV